MNGLSIRSRLSLAWKSLTSPFSTEGGQAAHGLLSGILRGSAGPVPERSTHELLATINSSPWVRACAQRVADCKAATQWKLYVGKNKITGLARADMGYAQKAQTDERRKILKALERTGELKEIQSHLFLDVHSANNAYFTGRDVRWLASMWYDMIGDVFLIKERTKIGSARGGTQSVWPIPPHWVLNTPTPSQPFYRVGWRGWQAEIAAEEILWMQNPNPVNPYGRGMGLARSIDDEISLDEFASKHMAAFFKNRAIPDVIVMPKEGGQFTPTERTRFEEFWKSELQGYWRAFKPLFLQSPVDIKTIDQNFRNLQMKELRDQERDIITQTWGIPPELFGIITSSNRSTIEMAPYIFGKYVMEPRLDRDRDFYQYRMLPEYDSKLILDYVSPIPEDKTFKHTVMTKTPQYFYANEFRTLAGYPEEAELDGLRTQPSGVQVLDEEGLPIQPEPPVDPNVDDVSEEDMTDDDAKALDVIFRRMAKRGRRSVIA